MAISQEDIKGLIQERYGARAQRGIELTPVVEHGHGEQTDGCGCGPSASTCCNASTSDSACCGSSACCGTSGSGCCGASDSGCCGASACCSASACCGA